MGSGLGRAGPGRRSLELSDLGSLCGQSEGEPAGWGRDAEFPLRALCLRCLRDIYGKCLGGGGLDAPARDADVGGILLPMSETVRAGERRERQRAPPAPGPRHSTGRQAGGEKPTNGSKG